MGGGRGNKRGSVKEGIQPMKYFNINTGLFFIIIYDLKFISKRAAYL